MDADISALHILQKRAKLRDLLLTYITANGTLDIRGGWDFVVTIPADPKIAHTIQNSFSHTYTPTDEGVFEYDYNDPLWQDMI